jgi:hypothetical protein
MDYKYIIYALLAAAIILAIILKDKIKASFLGMKLNAENTMRKNKAKIIGDDNELDQSSPVKGSPANNGADISGKGNKVKQS